MEPTRNKIEYQGSIEDDRVQPRNAPETIIERYRLVENVGEQVW